MAPWGYRRINFNIFTTAGFFILITALVCYLFRTERANFFKDIAIATRRSRPSMSTLCVGSATVYLLVDSGQIALLGRLLSRGGAIVYTALYPIVAFLGGIAFGQGLPGDYLFSQMQVSVAPRLGIPLVVLVGIVTVIAMGPTNALKPTQIAYSSSLANVKGKDGEIFRMCLRWEVLQLIVAALLSVVLALVWK
jgi:lactate permease